MEMAILSPEEKKLMRKVQIRSHGVCVGGPEVNMPGIGVTY